MFRRRLIFGIIGFGFMACAMSEPIHLQTFNATEAKQLNKIRRVILSTSIGDAMWRSLESSGTTHTITAQTIDPSKNVTPMYLAEIGSVWMPLNYVPRVATLGNVPSPIDVMVVHELGHPYMRAASLGSAACARYGLSFMSKAQRRICENEVIDLVENPYRSERAAQVCVGKRATPCPYGLRARYETASEDVMDEVPWPRIF